MTYTHRTEPCETTLLGVTYPGKPMFGSLALYLVNLEQRDGREAAEKSLDAHERMNGKPIDLASQFTPYPMSMATRLPKMLAMIEEEGLTDVRRDRDPDSGNERVAA
jgi:hypothetical protein